ncbi:ciliated left-right organizer metallopeptidase [Labrus mixtus]|uniref:ciliated left-right organizer metallopeptidase n=1 Tax=Labrus mixtus TaxID=508554 RepID=UPI0029BFF84A|nr:ciliated left-right organizer metallopeptidase [Labrus mixtus]
MLVLVVLVVLELTGVQPKCIFDEVQAQVTMVQAAANEPGLLQPTDRTGQRASPLRKSLKGKAPPTASSPQPIRIRTWIAKESNNLSEAEKKRMEAAVEQAVRTVSSLLSVNRVVGPLLLSRDVNKYCKFLWRNSSTANYNRCGRANSNYRTETCLDVTIPDDHLAGCDIYIHADSPHRTEVRPGGAGLADADFLLYLHIKSTDKCRAKLNILAYAAHCQTDALGRPVAGVVVICRERLKGETFSHQAAVQTVIHELFHVLGFSKELFHTWRDCSSMSQAEGADCSPQGKVTYSDGSGHMRIYTPSVISALQKHLNSTDPELGGWLENLGVLPGKVSSHWESRVFQGSIMAAELADSSSVRIDPVTLAALQDTGWYNVDVSRAQSLVWGDGEGAMFGSLSTCQNKSSPFFCSGSGFGCHYLHLHKGECKTDQYLEGCRVYKPLKNGSECWKKENPRRSAEEDSTGEIFGFDSRCFFSSLTRQNRSQFPSFISTVEGRCYRHRCTGPNRYQIHVSGSEWVECPAGGSIQIEGYQGSVSCPDRRLCLYSDITPPSDAVDTFPASVTRDPYGTLTSAQTWTSLSFGVKTSLGITAAVCLLAAVLVSYRKCCSCRIRIHTSTDEHSNL